MRIRFIKAAETHSLRHRVLRPHQPVEEVDFPNDRNPDSFHLGAAIGTHVVCVASFYNEKHPELRGWKQFRLRGMATHPEFQGQGVGREIILFALEHLKAQKADLLWCNARTTASAFYTKLGFKVHGEEFAIEGAGPHYMMYLRL